MALRRSTLKRLYLIDTLLRSGQYPNRPELARTLRVARSTVQRDLDELKGRFGAPIVYDNERHGYAYSSSFIPKLPDLPWDDALGLAEQAARRGTLAGTALAACLWRLRQKVEAVLEDIPRPRGVRKIRRKARKPKESYPAKPILATSVQVAVRFDARAAEEIGSLGGPEPSEAQMRTDGGLEATFTTRDPEGLLLSLLRWAGHFEIMKPRWVKRRYLNLLRRLTRQAAGAEGWRR